MECEECEEEIDEIIECVSCKGEIENLCEDCVEKCEECDDHTHNECLVRFENADFNICKSCIDEQYKREEKVVEKIVEVPKETKKVIGFSEPIL